MASRIFAIGFGAFLVICGIVILSSGALAVPTRHPPVSLHFGGGALALLGLSPILAGIAVGFYGRGWLERDSLAMRCLLGAAIVCCAAAFAWAPKF